MSQIWPPNHYVRIFDVVDPEGDPFTIGIKSITQDVSGPGRASPDGVGTWPVSGPSAPAHRTAASIGISFVATDDKGAAAEGSVLVCVPHDQGVNTACVDDGQVYDSTRP